MRRATLSVSTVVFPEEDVLCRRHFGWLRSLGIGSVEVSKDDARACYADRASLGEVRREADRADVRLASLHAWCGLDGVDEVCRTAAELGAGLVVVHCPHEALASDFGTQVQRATAYVRGCSELRMIPTVENSSRQPLEPFVRLFRAVPELKLTLDVKHACKPETLGLTHKDYMRALGDRLANVHVSGINRARDPVTGDGTPPGDDLVDWHQFADDLRDRDYAGLVTIESHLPNYLTDAEQEEAYADLPDVDTPRNTIPERLSSYVVAYYREHLAAALAR
ncbi:MAG: sugar phosphate isomerase/epimerase family protein [Planctomycetota bacterium]